MLRCDSSDLLQVLHGILHARATRVPNGLSMTRNPRNKNMQFKPNYITQGGEAKWLWSYLASSNSSSSSSSSSSRTWQ